MRSNRDRIGNCILRFSTRSWSTNVAHSLLLLLLLLLNTVLVSLSLPSNQPRVIRVVAPSPLKPFSLQFYSPNRAQAASFSGFCTTHTHTHTHTTHARTRTHTVGLLWKSDQPVAGTLPTQHTSKTREEYSCCRRDSNPRPPQPIGRRPTT